MSIQQMKSGLVSVSLLALVQGVASAGGTTPALPSAVPSNPSAGECYARVKIPARYETQSRSVKVEDGFTKYQVEQPLISSRAHEVMVKEPSVEYRVRQPRYESVTEKLMVRPAYEKLKVAPPQFQTITETVQVSSSRLIWKKGNPAQLRAQGYVIHSTANAGPGGQGYSSTTQYGAVNGPEATLCADSCEIWCLVEEPGQSVSYNRKVLSQPSMIYRVPVAAKYQSITKQVLVDPGGVEEIPIPAKYQTVMMEDVIPARATGSYDVPAVYNDVAVNVPVEDERWEWRRVVCETGTFLEPTTHSTHTQTVSGHTSSNHSASWNQQSTTTATTPRHVDEKVCRDHKRSDCYGQDVIDAYRSSRQNDTYHYDSSTGYGYDKSTGYYHDGATNPTTDGRKREDRRYKR